MRRIRRRTQARWCALAVSGLLHTGVVVALSAAMQPIDLGQVGKLLVTAQLVSEPAPLEALDVPGREDRDEPEWGTDIDVADDGAALQGLLDGMDLQRGEFAVQPQLASTEITDNLAAELVPASTVDPPALARRREHRMVRSGQKASFFGTVAYGDVFVYVLDTSSSMNGARFERARDELTNSVDALRVDQSFYVLLFNNGTRPMFDNDSANSESLSATPENKRKLREWLATIRPSGGTDPRDALRLGVGMKPSAVFLLSDGQFNTPSAQTRRLRHGDRDVLQMIGKKASHRIPIHTFAYESTSAAATMQTIASETGGTYRFVAAQNTDAAAAPLVSPEQTSQTMLAQAEAVESNGDLQAAAAMYQKIVETFPHTQAARKAELHKGFLSLLLPYAKP
jgi:Mg-chelatase subunit ChlD